MRYCHSLQQVRRCLCFTLSVAVAGGCGGEDSGSKAESTGSSSSHGDGGSTNNGGGNSPLNLSPTPGCKSRGESLPIREGDTVRVTAAGTGKVEVDGKETTLRAVVAAAAEGDTILLEDGVYTFDEAGADSYTGLYITTANITIQGASGDASAVILDSNYADHGMESGVISVDAPGVVLADFTVQESIFHLIHIWENGDDTVIHNVTMIDGGQQFLKASPGEGTVDNGEVSCSRFVMTDAGRDNVWGYGDQDGWTTCYTGGIDTHGARNWHIHDSYFESIYCDTEEGRPAHGKKGSSRENKSYAGGLSEHAIHMWDSEEGSAHLIERNLIANCARGIGLGLRDTVYGGTVRNNMIFSEHAASREHDVALIIERGVRTVVAHNTIFYTHENRYPSAIEIRWGETSGVTVNANLLYSEVSMRDSAAATVTDNVNDAPSSTFKALSQFDLHLADCSASTPTLASGVTDDFDGEARTASPHAGADQCVQ